MTEVDLRETLARPALLADVVAPLAAGQRLLDELPPDSAGWRAVRDRVDELLVRIAPQEVLSRRSGETDAATTPLDLRLQVEALLELGRDAEAGVLLAGVAAADPWWDILRARARFQAGDRDAALRGLDGVIADAATAGPEALATALSFRLRYRALVGDAAGAHADRDALQRLCVQHDAVLSAALIESVGRYAELPEATRRTVAQGLFRAALQRTMAELCDGVTETQDGLGPLPLWVHGLFIKLRRDPPRLVDLALRLAQGQLLCAEREAAYRTLYYADQLGARLLPAPASESLRQGLEQLLLILGPAEVALCAARREAEAAAHLSRAGRRS